MDRVLLKVHEMAALLSISRSTAYDMVREGTVRSVKLGRSIRVRPEDLRSFVDGLREDTDEEGEIRLVKP